MKQKTVIKFLNEFGVDSKNNLGTITFPRYESGFTENYNLSILPFRFYKVEKPQYGYLFLDTKTAIYGDLQQVTLLRQNREYLFDNDSGLKYVQWKKSNNSGDIIDG